MKINNPNLPSWIKHLKGELTEGVDDVTLAIDGPIGDFYGVDSGQFGNVLRSIPKNKLVNLHINTLGGKIDTGIAIHNMIVARGNVNTCVVGYAASMGAIIHQAGAKRSMMPGTMLIVHNPQMGVDGEADDMEKAAQFLRQVKGSLVDLLVNRTGQKPDAISKMMDDTTSMDPKQAKEAGFCDEVIDGSPAWNSIEPSQLVGFVKTLKNNLGGQPANDTKQTKPKQRMSKVNELLARFKLVPSNDMTDDLAAHAAETSIAAIIAERDKLKVENDAHNAALKLRVENRVNTAIQDKKIKPERKDSLIAMGLRNEADLDFLDDIAAPSAKPERPPHHGSPPAPTAPSNDVQSQIDNLRGQLHGASPAEAGRIAKQLRDLRGHKDLFAAAK